MTPTETWLKPLRMARPKKYIENMVARFVEGTFARLDGVLGPGEDRAAFVRSAVEAETAAAGENERALRKRRSQARCKSRTKRRELGWESRRVGCMTPWRGGMRCGALPERDRRRLASTTAGG